MSGNQDAWVVRDAGGLGRALAHGRRTKGYTQAELADLAGINRQYLSDLERGQVTEQTERLLRLLRRLGLELTITPRDD